jgi:hypothetical protein
MDNPNASSSEQKSQKPQSGKDNKPLAKGHSPQQSQQAELSDDEKSVDSQSEFSRLDKLRNEEE